MLEIIKLTIPDEAAMQALGAQIAAWLLPGDIIFLQGELGAGKTTLMRGLLKALGVNGPIKSPTYTLVESYKTPRFLLAHFDCYRLQDVDEWYLLGVEDYFTPDTVCILEWPERVQTALPLPTLRCVIHVLNAGRTVQLAATRQFE